MEKKELPSATLRATPETQQQLKVIAALTREKMHVVLSRLVRAEFERVQKEQQKKSEQQRLEDEGQQRLF